MNLNGFIECEDPNPHLYEFKGILNLENSPFFDDETKQLNTTIHNFEKRKSLFNESEYTEEVANIFKNIIKEGKLYKKFFFKI